MLRKAKARLYAKQPLKIVIRQATPASGTTHLALAIANLLVARERLRVLYVEGVSEATNTADGIIALRDASHRNDGLSARDRNPSTLTARCGFTARGIDFLPSCRLTDISGLYVSDYDAVIYELRRTSKDAVLSATDAPQQGAGDSVFIGAEALPCDRLLVTASAKPWHYRQLQQFLHHRIQSHDSLLAGILCVFGLTDSERKRLHDEFRLPLSEIPVIRDPFFLTAQDVGFLRRLLA